MNYELSYPRQHRGFFRLKTPNDEYLLKFLHGRFKFISSDNQRGILTIRTDLVVDGDIGRLTWDEGIVIPPDAVEMEGPDFWRLCFSRRDEEWRVLNEVTFRVRCHTPEYTGIMRVDWWDRSTHLYHYGKMYQLSNRKVLVVPSESLAEPDRTPRVNKLMDRVQKLLLVGK